MRILHFGITRPCPSHEGHIKRGRYYFAAFIALVCLSLLATEGCKKQNKALVSAHNAVGSLLISTQGQVKTLYTEGIINEQTYQKIRVNWLRAQKSYLSASDMLDQILSTNTTDITGYTELITQASNILSDIALWLGEEGK